MEMFPLQSSFIVMVCLISHRSIYCNGSLPTFFRAITCWEVERSLRSLLGMISNSELCRRVNSRAVRTFNWSRCIKDRRKREHWPFPITLGTSWFFYVLNTPFRWFWIDAVSSILTKLSSNNAAIHRNDTTKHSEYLPLVQMSESPHDKYNLVKKYFDLVPPDSLSKTGKAIRIFQQPASQAQVAVRSFLFFC